MCNGSTRRRREKETEEIFETIMTEDFPKSTAGANPQVQEAQRTPNRINAPKTAPWQVIFKVQKIKDEKSQRGKITLPVEEQRTE